jgi:hypothetical protein
MSSWDRSAVRLDGLDDGLGYELGNRIPQLALRGRDVLGPVETRGLLDDKGSWQVPGWHLPFLLP